MSTSTLIVDYLGVGTHAARPATPNIPAAGIAFYKETDNGASLYFWDSSAWVVVATGAAAGTVTHSGGSLTTHGVVLAAGAGDVKSTAAPTDGQLLIGHTGADPDLATLTAGTGITITNASGSITIAAVNLGTVTHTGGALTAHAPLVGAGSADIKALAAMTNGQLLIGSSGADPVPGTITGGTGIQVLNGAGSITLQLNTDAVLHSGGSLTQYAPVIGGASSNEIDTMAALTDGQLIMGVTGASPIAITLTAGTGIGISSTGTGITVKINDTAVTPGTYGDGTHIPTITVDQQGRITSASQTAVTIGGTVTHTSGALTNHAPMVGAGSADSKTLAAMTDGQLMIGHTGADPDLATLTAGNGINITNAAGSITVKVPDTAVTPATYGDGTHVGQFTVDQQGRITAASSVAITNQGTVTHTGGALTAHAPIVGAGSADEKALAAMTDGQLMIGVTGADPALATLTAGSGVTITPAAGSITIAATGSGGTVTNTGGSFTTHGQLIAAGAGDLKSTAAPTDGQLLIGKTSNDPVLATLTAGTGISVTNGAGTITIAATGSGGSTTLAGDTDVNISSIADTDLLTYDSGSSKWVNKPRTIVGSYQWHPACDFATTIPLSSSVTYSNGTSGVGATLTNAGTQVALSVDGVAVSAGQRILVKDQATQSQNGIYTVTTVGSGSTNWVLTRATDADGSAGSGLFGASSQVFVSGGNQNSTGVFYIGTNADPIVFGTTNISATLRAGRNAGLYASVMTANVPTQSNTGLTSWMNQGSATATDNPTGISLQGVASQDWQLIKRSAPATTYSITALVVFNTPTPQNFIGCGIGFTDGTKIHAIHMQSNNNILVSKWSNTTTFSANDAAINTQNLQGVPVWFKITDDGTTVKFYYSYDGGAFTQAFSVSRASGYLGSSGYTNVFFGVNSNTAATLGTLMSWAVGS